MLRTVLIVEDARPCASMLEVALLAVPGVEVRTASNGEEALHMLRQDSVSAMITDLHMPAMDGFELIEQVRADGRHATLPIIVVSGDTDPHTPERIRRLGADAYFAKPYSPIQLRNTLRHLMEGIPAPQ